MIRDWKLWNLAVFWVALIGVVILADVLPGFFTRPVSAITVAVVFLFVVVFGLVVTWRWAGGQTAIRDWHSGQLAVFCVALAYSAWVLYRISPAYGNSSFGYTSAALAVVVIPTVVFRISWVWFGSHKPSA